ncbi:polysaccharide biosynthesis/export family protein [Rubrimonas cliftonensis]|uniref:Polysaccharide export outer membrane protein n=1 Tax=Rubrimonas cliftonensis TaxID=89524 RepID=A0A1H4CUY8_9RHOB|nr:polysaccharide biosynthesis/export family protein [Rubrimonas cliftonensis]SEA64185.1 polysaccharide export outer membrane protein [Rubrimonas cliftonensis]
MVRTILAAIFATALAVAASAQTGSYRIALGDRLTVTVLEDPGLNSTLLVRPDGRISMPLAGTLPAADRTPEALQADIRRALAAQFVEPPTVTVALAQQGLAEETLAAIYVIGQVARPGRYDVALPIDVLQALALSGGLGVFAATDRIQVRRDVDGAQSALLFDYEVLEDGAVPINLIQLFDGDVIVVPERGLFE